LNTQGRQVGLHSGLAGYTIGQRKGLGIAAPEPMYVISKDPARNALLVGSAVDLGGTELIAAEVNWINGREPTSPLTGTVKIRYQAKDAPALIEALDHGRVRVRFMQPLRDITSGQRAVFYQGEECLGGGVIQG
jgi:tRNA-specific 2-thiouridylase